jgi:hypothetical protein
MSIRTRQALEESLTAFHRKLYLASAPYIVIPILGFLLARTYENHRLSLPDWARPWALVVPLTVIIIVGYVRFLAMARRCSVLSNLVCAHCGEPLGFYTATLRKTGACGRCGVKLYESA